MAAPVKVKFEIQNARELNRAFDSIEKRVKKLAKAEERAARDSAAATRRRIQAERATSSAARGGAYRTPGTITASHRQIERNARAHATRMAKIRERSALMAGKLAEKSANAEIRAAQKSAREQIRLEKSVQTSIQKRNRARAKGLSTAFGKAGRSTVGSISGMAGGLGLTAGGAMLTNALMSSARHKYEAQIIANAARNREGDYATSGTTGETIDAQYLTDVTNKMATTYGVDPRESLAGLGLVSERAGGAAGLDAATQDWEHLTRVALAYGSSMEDMGAVVAAALNAGVKPGQEMRDLVESMVAMGKEGSIEFRNLGSELPKLVGAAKATEMTGSEGVREMVALAQLAVTAAVSPEEARTSVVNSIADVGKKEPLLRKAGVDVYNEEGKIRRTRDLIGDIFLAAEKNPSKFGKDVKNPIGAMMKVFDVRSKKMAMQLFSVFEEAGGGEKGRAAVKEKVATLAGANLGEGELEKSLGGVSNTELQKARVAFQKFNVEASKMLPKVIELLPVLGDLALKFADLSLWVSENPFSGLGALFGANLVKELASAQIGRLINTAFGAQAGAGLAIAATAVTIAAGGVKIIDMASEIGAKSGQDVFSASMESTAMLGRASRGELSKDEMVKLEEDKATLKKFSQRSEHGAVGEVASDFGIMDAYSPFKSLFKLFGESAKESQGITKESAAVDVEAINSALMSGAAAQKEAAANLAKAADKFARSGVPPTR